MLGGGIATLLSILPVVSTMNVCFGLWIIVGGAVSVWHLQKKVGTVPMGEAAAVGALSGLVVGVTVLLLTLLLGTAFGALLLAEASHREQRETLPILALLLGGSCGATILVYPFLACIGGVLAGLLLKPSAPAVIGPNGVPMAGAPAAPSPEELAASAASRKKWGKILGCGCVSVLGLCAALCGISGYLLYLENGVDLEDTAATEEFASVPLVPGQVVSLELPSGGAHATRNAIWLVGDSELPPGLDVSGEYGCDESTYGEPSMRTLYTYPRPTDGHPEWMFLTDYFGYSYRSVPIRCRFQLTTTVPVPGARIVVTRLHRPSDWFE